MERISRREFIRAGLGSAAAAALLRDPFRLFAAARKDGWATPVEARISYASGEVFLNDARAGSGSPVARGDTIRTGLGSEAEVEVRDYSVFNIRENSVVRLNDALAAPEMEVKKGWFLVIVKKGTPVKLKTPMVLAGIRGTVVFLNVLGDDQSYLCNCNGKVELVDPRTGEEVRTVSSSYHTAYQVGVSQARVSLVRAGLLYHTDDDILRMAGRFRRETEVFRARRDSGSGRSGY